MATRPIAAADVEHFLGHLARGLPAEVVPIGLEALETVLEAYPTAGTSSHKASTSRPAKPPTARSTPPTMR